MRCSGTNPDPIGDVGDSDSGDELMDELLFRFSPPELEVELHDEPVPSPVKSLPDPGRDKREKAELLLEEDILGHSCPHKYK